MFGHFHLKDGLSTTSKTKVRITHIYLGTKIMTNRSVQEEIIEIIKNAGIFYQLKDILRK
jgi:hypothetical protein